MYKMHCAGIPATDTRPGDTLIILDDVRVVVVAHEYRSDNKIVIFTRCVDRGSLDVVQIGNPFSMLVPRDSQIEILSRGAAVPPVCFR